MTRAALLSLALVAAPAAAEDAPLPRHVPGSVVAVGGGTLPAAVRAEVFRLAGGADARVVVIPTASGAADDPAEAESFLAPWRALGPAGVTLLHTRDRQAADTPGFTVPLRTATLVWLSGGDQSSLTAAYRGTVVETALHAVVRRGGVVGGTSAGAAVLGDPMIAGGADVPRLTPGFGLLAGVVIDQHFTERKRFPRLDWAVRNTPGVTGVGVDEGTAVIVTGRTVRVLGKGTATLVLAAGRPPEVLKSGAAFVLPAARR